MTNLIHRPEALMRCEATHAIDLIEPDWDARYNFFKATDKPVTCILCLCEGTGDFD